MKVNRKLIRKIKRIFKPLNLLIITVIIALCVAIYFFVRPGIGIQLGGEQVSIVKTNVKSDQEISENDAKKVAVKQFKQLGEKVSVSDIKSEKIQRKGELYYYLTSLNNTMEIKIVGGQVTRINSVPVEQ